MKKKDQIQSLKLVITSFVLVVAVVITKNIKTLQRPIHQQSGRGGEKEIWFYLDLAINSRGPFYDADTATTLGTMFYQGG